MATLSCIDIAEAFGLQPAKRSGNEYEYLYLCPRHDDHNPSLQVNVKKDCFLCGPCNAEGNAWNLAAFLNGWVYPADKDLVHNWLREHSLLNHNETKQNGSPEAVYEYRDASGQIVFEIVRFPGKKFRARRKDKNGEYVWNLEGVPRIAFQFDQISKVEELFWTEGERDALSLWNIGLPATTSPFGASQVERLHEATKCLKRSHRVVILPDNDRPGQEYAQKVAALLSGQVASVSILNLPGLAEKGDVSDWLKGKDPEIASEELCKLADSAPEWKVKTESLKESLLPTSVVVSADELRSMQLPERDWIIQDVQAHPSALMIFSPGGLGKTRLMLSKAISTVQGTKFLAYDVPKSRRELFVDGELTLQMLQSMLFDLAGTMTLPGLDLISSEKIYELLDGPLNLNSSVHQEAFLRLLDALDKEQRRPDVICFDNISTLFLGKEENSNTDQEPANLFVIKLRHLGFTIDIVHHAGTSGNQRGATRRMDILDTVIKLSEADGRNPDGARFKFTFTKTRCKPPKPFSFECDLVQGENNLLTWSIGKVERGLPVWIQILKWIADNTPEFQKDIAEAFGVSSASISQHLGKLRDEKGFLNGLKITESGSKFLSKKYPKSDE